MALAGSVGPLPCRLPLNSRSPAINRPILALPKKTSGGCRKKFLCVRFSASSATPTAGSIAPAISLSDKAFNHLNKMRVDKNEDLCLRIGVKQGGCSGMSYTMEFENRANTRSEDSLIEYKGFTIVCDPKSLLYVYGMQLDFSDALIGGGFSFKNPNATKTCGCGKSFAAAGENVELTENSNHCGS
ncbi:iron-sulfur assembly protein IscA, chloroplastic isoform X1 [Dendrobium catenatum]|uniref:Iron-sulfur assembly protein IscA, chloroplastic n=1 Tax=Dendrobium catenatum TaxID=906689 RepID=A0A2I0X2L2_9ASPA|nr:iron-sulfur assembly protein IscA, chloroplastic isoform X1 [Dendrobium catenatum]PKU82145.1 Iron-sulfur assembly protein IscA, chloroplastic [Dendrobium catenatum]